MNAGRPPSPGKPRQGKTRQAQESQASWPRFHSIPFPFFSNGGDGDLVAIDVYCLPFAICHSPALSIGSVLFIFGHG